MNAHAEKGLWQRTPKAKKGIRMRSASRSPDPAQPSAEMDVNTYNLIMTVGAEDAGCVGFEVDARTDCPHLHALPSTIPERAHTLSYAAPTCDTCGAPDEAWVCLTCYHVGCSRYSGGHGAAHAGEGAGGGHGGGANAVAGVAPVVAAPPSGQPPPGHHCLALSLADMSVWCYTCAAYLDVFKLPALHPSFRLAYRGRFGEEPALPQEQEGGTEAGASASGSPYR